MGKIPMLRRIQNIHLIGIGGSGMNGIAEVLLALKYQVSGSDYRPSAITERLRSLGAKIFYQHAAAHLQDADVVVVSSAIGSDNPELIEAMERHLPIISRAEMLAELMRFHYGIAVAGTHGKTTTTSMVASILSEANLDPTFVVGGILNSASVSARLGEGYHFVVEADESDASFLNFNPMASIVTNIDADHMQTYGNDPIRLRKAFADFLHRLPFYGLAVLCIDDPVVRELIPEVARPVISYGFSEDADVRIQNFTPTGFGSQFMIDIEGQSQLELQLNIPGRHSALNAVAAAIVAMECCSVDSVIVARALEQFAGVGRRMQRYGELVMPRGRVVLVDDYGHHPREIRVTLDALRSAFPGRRLVLAFQPHRYSRTRDLFEDFVEALSEADEVLVMEIYPASEEPIPGVDSQQLVARIQQKQQTTARWVADNDDLIRQLPEVLKDNDLLLIQGAGGIGTLAPRLQLDFGATASVVR